MIPLYAENWPQFFTATISKWKHLLKYDGYKDIIIDSLRYAVENKRINLCAFVIMINHIHIVWQQLPPFDKTQAHFGFMKYTAQQIKFDLQKANPKYLEEFKVGAKNREYPRLSG